MMENVDVPNHSDDWDIDLSDLSSNGGDEEDIFLNENSSGKSGKQTSADEKSARKRKSADENCDGTVKKSGKKKFSLRSRKRRQADKALLEVPEDRIDPMQISIRDLIFLAESKERKSNKEAAQSKKEKLNNLKNSSSSGTNQLDEGDCFTEELNGDETNKTIEEETATTLNYHSYMNKPKSTRWSKQETELLYKAIRQIGTDFTMIQKLFPNRTRHQLKLKFKNEERKHPLELAEAIAYRSKDLSHFELVIEKLQIQNQDPDGYNEDLMNPWEDANGQEEMTQRRSKVEPETNSLKDDNSIQSPSVSNDERLEGDKDGGGHEKEDELSDIDGLWD